MNFASMFEKVVGWSCIPNEMKNALNCEGAGGVWIDQWLVVIVNSSNQKSPFVWISFTMKQECETSVDSPVWSQEKNFTCWESRLLRQNELKIPKFGFINFDETLEFSWLSTQSCFEFYSHTTGSFPFESHVTLWNWNFFICWSYPLFLWLKVSK
jgi:hypothetical protein